MGSGIAIAFAQAGVPVVVVDTNEEAVDKARQTVMGMFMYQVQKGRLTQEEAWQRGQSITFTDDWSELADADLVVEAVFEDPDVKREVFAKLDGDRQARGIAREQHLDARHRRDGRGDQTPGKGSRAALLRAGEHHAAARDRARERDVRANAGDGLCNRQDVEEEGRALRATRSGSSATG